MKKFLFLIVVLAAIAVGLMLTCPDRDAHREVWIPQQAKAVTSMTCTDGPRDLRQGCLR